MRIGMATLFTTGALAGGLLGRSDDPPTTTVTTATAELVENRGVHWWAKRTKQARRDANKRGRTILVLRRTLRTHAHHLGGSVTAAICAVFGGYCQQALAVARCESRFDIYATNGQYLGLFQMGSSERARYGHGWDAYSQARAAFRYFVASGKDWSPWQCRP